MSVLTLILILVCAAVVPAAEGPLVVVVVVDGLSPDAVSAMPRLGALSRSEGATVWTRARAVMPSVTNTNHASVVTGVYAETHGITGNNFWDRKEPPRARSLDLPGHLEVETLFTAAGRVRPGLRTAAVFGKAKLGRLFAAGEKQKPPGWLWTDEKLDRSAEGLSGTDTRVMTEALRALEEESPDFLFVALAGVDLASHGFGPESDQARRAAAAADREVGRLFERLRDDGRWGRTILFVTSDHSFASLGSGSGGSRPSAVLGRALKRAGLESGFFVVADGTLAHVYRRRGEPVSLGGETSPLARRKEEASGGLTRAAEVLGSVPAVEVVLTPEAIRKSHPDWRVSHPRMGDLVVLARPGHQFNDPFHPVVARFRGHHGGPRERPIPMLVAGGHPWLREGTRRLETPADNADLGATVFALLGLVPGDADGKTLPKAVRGRILSEAFDAEPSSDPRLSPLGRGGRYAPGPTCARWRSQWSARTQAIIASPTGTARMPTHGS